MHEIGSLESATSIKNAQVVNYIGNYASFKGLSSMR